MPRVSTNEVCLALTRQPLTSVKRKKSPIRREAMGNGALVRCEVVVVNGRKKKISLHEGTGHWYTHIAINGVKKWIAHGLVSHEDAKVRHEQVMVAVRPYMPRLVKRQWKEMQQAADRAIKALQVDSPIPREV